VSSIGDMNDPQSFRTFQTIEGSAPRIAHGRDPRVTQHRPLPPRGPGDQREHDRYELRALPEREPDDEAECTDAGLRRALDHPEREQKQ
jgi:hypothetical protein